MEGFLQNHWDTLHSHDDERSEGLIRHDSLDNDVAVV